MAQPMTPDEFIRVLKAEGLRVAEYPGWRTRERDAATGKPFGPVRMILNHHTAGRNSLTIVARDGVSGLPGPLAHVHLDKSGLATMCSAGRANHAGAMGADAYASFADEHTTHPAPSRASGTIDGNDVSYGIEVENLGDLKDAYPREQYDALVRFNAAICRHYGWSADSCAGHLETSVEGKVDPRGPVEDYGTRDRFALTMKQLRADIAERLAHPANWSPETTPTQEDPMAGITKQDIYDAVWKTDQVASPPDQPDAATNPTWAPQSYLKDIDARVRAIQAQEAGQTAAIVKLASLAGSGVDTAAVVAAVQQAIAAAVVDVNVSVGTAAATN